MTVKRYLFSRDLPGTVTGSVTEFCKNIHELPLWTVDEGLPVSKRSLMLCEEYMCLVSIVSGNAKDGAKLKI